MLLNMCALMLFFITISGNITLHAHMLALDFTWRDEIVIQTEGNIHK